MAAARSRFGALTGLDHIGLGVSDMAASMAFYGDLSFTEVAFDYTGPLPGLEKVAGRSVDNAHVVMLRSNNPTAVGLGAIKLVQALDAPVPPLPEGIGWGEPGICEVCIHVRNQPEFYRWLVEGRGATSLMEPCDAPNQPPNNTHASLSYVSDPDGGKIELIEWMHPKEWPERTALTGSITSLSAPPISSAAMLLREARLHRPAVRLQ